MSEGANCCCCSVAVGKSCVVFASCCSCVVVVFLSVVELDCWVKLRLVKTEVDGTDEKDEEVDVGC
jgi:hypothetical protein